MSLQERRDYAQGFDKLAELLSKRQASPEEAQKIDGLRQQARAMLAAEVFRQEPPERAVQKHPELAGAAAVLTAIDKKAEADGMNEQQRAIIMARARQNVANSIERGELPEVKIREERQTKIEPTQRDPER